MHFIDRHSISFIQKQLMVLCVSPETEKRYARKLAKQTFIRNSKLRKLQAMEEIWEESTFIGLKCMLTNWHCSFNPNLDFGVNYRACLLHWYWYHFFYIQASILIYLYWWVRSSPHRIAHIHRSFVRLFVSHLLLFMMIRKFDVFSRNTSNAW